MIRAVGCSRSDRTAVGSMTCTVDTAAGGGINIDFLMSFQYIPKNRIYAPTLVKRSKVGFLGLLVVSKGFHG